MRSLTTTTVVVTLAITSSFSAFGQNMTASHRPTAQQLFNSCTRCVPPQNNNASAGQQAQAQQQAPIAVLRSPGNIVSGATANIVLDIKNDYPNPVSIAGQVFSVDGFGTATANGDAFYASKDLALTAYGPGYFPNLNGGAVIPFGEVPTGNAGAMTTVVVQIFDAASSGPVGPPLTTTFWNIIKAVSVIPSMAITSASFMTDGVSMVIKGTGFPVSEPVIIEIGGFGWATGFVATASGDGKTLQFSIPPDAFNTPLYPANWPAMSWWGATITKMDGTSVTATNLLLVQGNGANSKVAQVQQ